MAESDFVEGRGGRGERGEREDREDREKRESKEVTREALTCDDGWPLGSRLGCVVGCKRVGARDMGGKRREWGEGQGRRSVIGRIVMSTDNTQKTAVLEESVGRTAAASADATAV